MSFKRNTKYLWSIVPGLFTVFGNFMGSWWVLSNLLFSLVFLAIIEFLLPEDKRNEASGDNVLPDRILFSHVLMQILALSSLFYSIHIGRIVGGQLIFAAISTGVHTGSSSIIVAHEMIHRKASLWQLSGKFLLLTAANIYFYVDHLRVHHKWVGTDRDPATAHKGESVYRFFLRSVSGQINSAWKEERSRLQKKGFTEWNLNNYVLTSILILTLILFTVYFFLGIMSFLVFMLQALVANFLLEYTNYIEHYGLQREENTRVNAALSWQSDKIVSRFLLIDLSRHSDHHFYASKPYHTLHSHSESPVLPTGYASAIYIAMIPPLWFKIMDPLIPEQL